MRSEHAEAAQSKEGSKIKMSWIEELDHYVAVLTTQPMPSASVSSAEKATLDI